MEDISRMCFVGGMVVYAWNVIDGIVAKGKKHVQVLGSVDVKLTPYVTPDLASGISLKLNF